MVDKLKKRVNLKRRLDLTGKVFGHLTAIKDVGADKYGGRIWLCQCDCGKKVEVRTAHLSAGEIIGCGCRRRLPEGEAALNALIERYRRNAKNRGLEFCLTREQFKELTKQECTYCGTLPFMVVRSDYCGFNGGYIYNGIDRMDNSIGYTLDNSVPCCGRCNWMKNNFTHDDFIAHISKIYRYSVICD